MVVQVDGKAYKIYPSGRADELPAKKKLAFEISSSRQAGLTTSPPMRCCQVHNRHLKGASPMTKQKVIERQQVIEKLREMLKPGDIVYTTLKHVSRSGMLRSIDVHIIRDNEPQWIARRVATAIDFSFDDRRECIKVQGCGMDMGFEVVYNLGRVLFPDGFWVKGKLPLGREVRPTSRENAAKAVERGAEFYGSNGDKSGWDNDGGYALKQRWM